MAHIHSTARRTKRFYGDLTVAVLSLLAGAGAITLAGMLGGGPTAARALLRMPGVSVRVIRRTLRRLRRIEYIGMAERNGEVIVTITERGRQRVLRANLDNLKLRKPRRWNRMWHVVIFDIPEGYSSNRDALRKKLRSLTFFKLQQSVYVTPYPCHDELDLLNEVFETRPFVHCLETRSLGVFENRARRYFQLH